MLIAVIAVAAPQAAIADPLRVMLPSVWQVQPATTPATPPAADRWGRMDSGVGDWRWSGLVGTKPSWGDVKRDTVNSLWYQQSLDVPDDWAGRRVVADFRRLEGDAIVFVNGARVAELLRPGGEIDVTSAVRLGQSNAITAFVTRDYTGISRGFKDDALRYAARGGADPLPVSRCAMGITGTVTVIARANPAAISDVFVRPSWRTKSLAVDVETDASTAATGLVAVADVIDADGKTVLTARSGSFDAHIGRSTHTATAAWPNPKLWELNGGYVYSARVRLESAGKVLDTSPDTRFGFREIWTSGKQIIMNGHPIRFRLASLGEGADSNPEGLSFLRLIGYNIVCFQNNPTAWWRDWAESPNTDDKLLDELDRTGMGATFPAPSINHLGGGLLSSAAIRDAYTREMALYLRRYRNHPSILALTVGMNAYNPMTAIAPQGMGMPDSLTHPKAQSIAAACAIARSVDPGALVYSHADGGVGDICSSNTYLNFAPLQEREEWPSAWASTGKMPHMAAEFGQPFTANFWKGKRSFLTEYMAMYLGDKAYEGETDNGLRSTIDSSLANTGFGAMDKVNLVDYPAYWDFQLLFVRNTDRAWRTWGVSGGWSYWVLDTGYGDPPSFKKGTNVFNRYRNVGGILTSRPSWANPNFDIHSEANQPLLAYIAGDPIPTDKTHSYYSGEMVKKNLAIVWDGPGDRTLTAEWRVGTAPAKSVAVTLHAGDVKLLPVAFPAAGVTVRRDETITMTLRSGNAVVAKDSFGLQIFPRIAPVATKTRVALFDPKGLSRPVLSSLGIMATAWKPGESLVGTNLLVIGREAMAAGMRPLYTPADLERGLRVIVLEQKPEIWKGLGFKITDTMPRYVFARALASPLLNGVQASDLINWRGTPNLLPEGVTLSHDVLHAPKWSNRHAVASVALQIPEAVGFTPVVSCEFDLNYTPLLECRYGKGQVTFCTLDLTGRVGVDPAATLLARNLFADAVTSIASPTRSLSVIGDAGPLAVAFNLPAPQTAVPASATGMVMVGSGVTADKRAELAAFVRAGGTAVQLPVSAAALKEDGYATTPVSLYRAPVGASSVMNAVSPSLLRWRDHVDADGFAVTGQPVGSEISAGGLVLTRRDGKGRWVCLQASPADLATRYAGQPDRAAAVQTSVSHLYQLTAQLLTNAGASASRDLVARTAKLDLGPAYEVLRQWQELGPFPIANDDGAAMLATKFPGEESAIAGDTNPNLDYVSSDGKRLNWRRTVMADTSGHVDIGDQLGTSGLAVAYFVKHIRSDKARTAMLRLGIDYRIAVWVNGELVFRTVNGRARPNSFQVKVPLKAGDNVISIKLGSGSKGFGFWSDLSAETAGQDADREPVTNATLYHETGPDFDPYEFHYW